MHLLTAVPEPTVTLDEVGRATYDRMTAALFNANKLTLVTLGDCECIAVMVQQLKRRQIKGEAARTPTWEA